MNTIPGAFLEAVLAHVRGGDVLSTYDYVDVLHAGGRVGWSIKSTKASTPVTWKRAKIGNKNELIAASRASEQGAQELGNAIMAFCNAHAVASLDRYALDAIGYARLILFDDGTIRYFERVLCTREKPQIFAPEDFSWKWSKQKTSTNAKERLSALHGFHRETGVRWWAWHGLGENQLHFTGERNWWPDDDDHAITFSMPAEADKLSFDRLLQMLDTL